MYTEVALEDLVERTLESQEGRPMAFFLGAGASAPSPSCLPQAKQIQEAVYDQVAPAGAEPRERELIIGALPEIYHEPLIELGGPRVREVWRVLSFWEANEEVPDLARFGLGPNLVHLLVVYLAWKSGRPVMTVNFDQMLERAAEELGLRPDVGLDAVSGESSVAVWKLHGTVADLRSIRTTMQAITAIDPVVHQRMKREFDRSSGCLIGYSGQDIDIFPFLCGWARPGSIHWLTLDLGGTAIVRAPRPFVGIDADADRWAREVIPRLPETDPIASRLKALLPLRAPDRDEVVAIYREELRQRAAEVFGDLFPPGHPKRMLAHAMALAALGDNVGADRWADRFLRHGTGRAHLCRAHLVKSAMAHEFARYRVSKDEAKAAARLARRGRLRPELAEAKIRVAQANRMLFVAPRLPCVNARELVSWRTVAVLAQMSFYAVALRRIGRSDADGRRDLGPARIRAQFEYLEHLVRLGAFFQVIAERAAPTAATGASFGRWWTWIEDKSYRAGYPHGITNARKYHYRVRPAFGEDGTMSVLDLYSLSPSPTGTAIHHRDIAERIAAELSDGHLDGDREARVQEALDQCGLAIAAAREAGDPSLELKVMLDQKALAPRRAWPRAEVSTLLDAIESPAYARLRERIIADLDGHSHLPATQTDF